MFLEVLAERFQASETQVLGDLALMRLNQWFTL